MTEHRALQPDEQELVESQKASGTTHLTIEEHGIIAKHVSAEHALYATQPEKFDTEELKHLAAVLRGEITIIDLAQPRMVLDIFN